MSINGYHHVGLIVKDMQKSLKFYEEAFGGRIVSGFSIEDGKEIFLVDLGNGAVAELIPRGTGESEMNAHWAHIALKTDSLDEDLEKAVSAGARLRSEPRIISIGGNDAKTAFIFGPDDEVIELFQS